MLNPYYPYSMLLIVLPVAWVALVLLALTMLRTVALSDAAYDVAVASWLAHGAQVGDDDRATPETIERPRHCEPRGRFRAAG